MRKRPNGRIGRPAPRRSRSASAANRIDAVIADAPGVGAVGLYQLSRAHALAVQADGPMGPPTAEPLLKAYERMLRRGHRNDELEVAKVAWTARLLAGLVESLAFGPASTWPRQTAAHAADLALKSVLAPGMSLDAIRREAGR